MKARTPKDGERYICRGVYVGPELPLRGCVAMLQVHPKLWRLCLAQFDDTMLRKDGKRSLRERGSTAPEVYIDGHDSIGPILKTSKAEDYLGFGWHEFRRKDFKSVSMREFMPPPILPVHTSIDQNGVRNIRIGA